MMGLAWVGDILSTPFLYLILLCLVIGALTYGIRDLMSVNAGLALALFFGLFVMSNAWRFVARPELPGPYEVDLALTQLWVAQAKAANEQAKLIGIAASLGLALWIHLRLIPDRSPTLTGLWLYTDFAAQLTEVPEFFLCKLTSEWLGREHIAIMEGLDRGACSREFGWWGSLVAPGLATLPVIVILWRTLDKRFAWFGLAVWWSLALRIWRMWRRA